MVRRKGNGRQVRSGQACNSRAVSQFAFELDGRTSNHVLQLFPATATGATFSLFPGITPGMVIRVTGLTITVAAAEKPGAFQWHDGNLAMMVCRATAGAEPTSYLGNQIAANDGTRNSACVTVGVNGVSSITVPMATNATFTQLYPSTMAAVGDMGGVRGHILGYLNTTALQGFATVTVRYQVGTASILGSALPIGVALFEEESQSGSSTATPPAR